MVELCKGHGKHVIPGSSPGAHIRIQNQIILTFYVSRFHHQGEHWVYPQQPIEESRHVLSAMSVDKNKSSVD